MAIGRCSGWLGGWSLTLVRVAAVALPAVLSAAACSLSVKAPQSSVGAAPGGPIPIEPDETVFGNPKAPVTLVTFIDLSHSASETMLENIEAAHGKAPDDLRYTFKFFPLCQNQSSRETAVAAKAVLELGGPDVFWRFQKLVFDHQPRLGVPLLRSAALEAGLPEEHLPALTDARFDQRVRRDVELGRALGVVSSPTSFMNGVRLNNVITTYSLNETLEQELPKARALADQKKSADEVYRLRTLENAKVAGQVAAPAADSVHSVPVGSSPSAGAEDAPITVVQFADFASGCSKAAQPELESLRQKHGSQLRVVFKHLALVPLESMPATRERWAANFAEFARESGGDAKFFEAEKLLWQSSPDFSLATLERLARQLGLDPAAALRAVDSDRYAERIDADIALAESLGLRAPTTWQREFRQPSYFINGHLVTDLASNIPEAWLEKPAAPSAPTESASEVAAAPAAGASESSGAPAAAPPAIAAPAAPTAASEPSTPSAAAAPPALAPDETLPFRGERNAPVVVDMFANYISASCDIPASLDRLMVEHPGQIKLVFRPVIWTTAKVFTAIRQRATEAALEAHAQRGNGGFWAITKLLCRDPDLTSFKEPEESARRDLTEFAKGANIDVDRFRIALQDKRHRPRIEAAAELAEKLGINPRNVTFFVNGQPLGGEDLYTRVKRLLRDAPPAPQPTPDGRPPGAVPQPDGAISRAASPDTRSLAEAAQ